MEAGGGDFGTPGETARFIKEPRSSPVDIPRESQVLGSRTVRRYATGSGRVCEAVFTYTPSPDSENGISVVVQYDPDTDRILDGDPIPDSEGYDTPPGNFPVSLDAAEFMLSEIVQSLRRDVTELQACVRTLTRRINRMERK